MTWGNENTNTIRNRKKKPKINVFFKSYHYPYSSWGAGGDALTNVKCYKALDGPYISFKEAILPLVMSSFLHPNKSIKKLSIKDVELN